MQKEDIFVWPQRARLLIFEASKFWLFLINNTSKDKYKT